MGISKYFFLLLKISKRLSVRASGIGFLAILAALLAPELGGFVPDSWAKFIGHNAVDEILKILASSMLVIVTFSIATMVSAYTAASQGVTPRAARLLIEDHQSQNAISTFLGVFIFSIVSMIALSTDYYGAKDRFIIFVFTALVIFLVVWTIFTWIEKLSKLGRVHNTVLAIERKTRTAMEKLACRLVNSCQTHDDSEGLGDALQVTSSRTGYVQSIYFDQLQILAKKFNFKIFIEVQTGSYVSRINPIALIKCENDLTKNTELLEEIQRCFSVSTQRLFESDPRFGLITLGEVASRALSPAVNDPGTAIDVIGSMTRLLIDWDEFCLVKNDEVKFDLVYMRKFSSSDFFENIVLPISRDGAGHIEVVIRLYKSLSLLHKLKDSSLSELALEYQKRVITRANLALKFDDDKKLLEELISKG